jgi:hypothetical protein
MDAQTNQPKGKANKGTGGKDQKRVRANKNITQNLPDRAKEAALESDITKQMDSVAETVFEPWERQLIRLQSMGWSLTKIIEKGVEARQKAKDKGEVKRRGFAAIPGVVKVFMTLRAKPELREACRNAFAFSVDSIAQETLLLFRSLDQVPGLKGKDLVDERYKRGLGTLNVAGRIVPDLWGEHNEGEPEVIVFEASGGWVPTQLANGPGQGKEAQEAAGKWRKRREEAKDV